VTLRSLPVDAHVLDDGMLGVKTRVDLPPGTYPSILVVGPAASVEAPVGPHPDELLPLAEFVESARRAHIHRALARCGGNRSRAARELDVDPRTVFRFIAEEEPGGS